MNDSEFDELINDRTKTINADISWIEDEDHSPTLEFRAEIESFAQYPIWVKGSFNPEINTLTYAIIHKAHGRIYALDMGKEHRNPTGDLVGELHKHRWRLIYRDKEAYVPQDITASPDDPLSVWQQFCVEAKIAHNGTMDPLPPRQLGLFD